MFCWQFLKRWQMKVCSINLNIKHASLYFRSISHIKLIKKHEKNQMSTISSSSWLSSAVRHPFVITEPFALPPLVSASKQGQWLLPLYRALLHLCSLSMDCPIIPCGDHCSPSIQQPRKENE